MRHTDARPGRAVKASRDFEELGGMSFPVEKNTAAKRIIRKGTRGRIDGVSVKYRGTYYVPVNMANRIVRVAVEYLDLA